MRNRPRKTKKGDFSEETMKKAVQMVKDGHSIRKAASEMGLAFQTLARLYYNP